MAQSTVYCVEPRSFQPSGLSVSSGVAIAPPVPSPSRVVACQVMRFGPIAPQIIKFPRPPPGCHEFPVANPNRAVPFVQPPKIFPVNPDVAIKGGRQAPTRCRRNLFAFPSCRFLDLQNVENRGHNVDDVSRSSTQCTMIFNASRPMNPLISVLCEKLLSSAIAATHPAECVGTCGCRRDVQTSMRSYTSMMLWPSRCTLLHLHCR